jgi:N-acetylneuraminic acid mutarotase
MKQTIYQVWRYNPLKDQWFLYNHIPYATTPEAVRQILVAHMNGEYKPKQYKAWMKNDKFKIVKVEQTFTDWEIL